MGLMRAACSKTPQSQGTSTPQPQGEANPHQVSEEKARNTMTATTDAKQAQFKARHTNYYHSALKLKILILDMIKPNKYYSIGHKQCSTQPGLDMPNKEEPNTAAQPQGGGQPVQGDRGEG